MLDSNHDLNQRDLDSDSYLNHMLIQKIQIRIQITKLLFKIFVLVNRKFFWDFAHPCQKLIKTGFYICILINAAICITTASPFTKLYHFSQGSFLTSAHVVFYKKSQATSSGKNTPHFSN